MTPAGDVFARIEQIRAMVRLAEMKADLEDLALRARAVGLVSEAEELEAILGQSAAAPQPAMEEPVEAAPADSSTPEPQPDPEPAPETEVEDSEIPEPAPTVEARPKVLPKADRAAQRAQRTVLQKDMKAFFEQERALNLDPVGDAADLARLKAMICDCRGLLEKCRLAEADSGPLERSLEDLKRIFNSATGAAPFFALSPSRFHRPEVWAELADGCRLTAAAERACQYMEADRSRVDAKLLEAAAAAQSYLFRLNDDWGLGITESQQKDLHERLNALRGKHWIRAWKTQPEERMPTPELKRIALELEPMLNDIEAKQQRQVQRAASNRALARLVEAIEGEEIEDDVVGQIRQAVADCLESGVPPTDKKLCEALLPYRHLLLNLQTAQGPSLTKALERLENMLFAKKRVPGEADKAAYPTFAEELGQLKEALRGKTVLFVGGRCDAAKQRALRSALELKDMIWPTTEPSDDPSTFESATRRADLVCMLVRFSRHSYKDVIDSAKAMGKLTAILKAGVGTNRVVYDLYRQLEPRIRQGA